MIDKAEERRQRAGEAQRLLGDPLLCEVLDAAHDGALTRLKAVEPDLEYHIEQASLIADMKAVDAIRGRLQGIVNEHHAAVRAKFKAV